VQTGGQRQPQTKRVKKGKILDNCINFQTKAGLVYANGVMKENKEGETCGPEIPQLSPLFLWQLPEADVTLFTASLARSRV
jgi:hypothetical protein